MQNRKAEFAGSWYPAGAVECRKQIEHFLSESTFRGSPDNRPVAGIVPHAGWYYSGGIACKVIHEISRSEADLIFIFGMHLRQGSPAFIMTKGEWDTPLGPIGIEERTAGALAETFSFTIETTTRYQKDNTIELQLPFIRYFFPEAKIVPMGLPPADISLEIGRTAISTAESFGLKSVVIGSTDLTHYGVNYGFAPKGSGMKALEWVRNQNDKAAVDAMISMNPKEVMSQSAANKNSCCPGAASAAIVAAEALNATKAEITQYATSYDKSPGDGFVGYAGILFSA